MRPREHIRLYRVGRDGLHWGRPRPSSGQRNRRVRPLTGWQFWLVAIASGLVAAPIIYAIAVVVLSIGIAFEGQ